MTHCATGFGFCCLFFTGGRPTRNHRIASFCRGFYALSGVEFLGEMRGFLNARALLPLIPPTPFSHKGRRGSLGVLKPKTREGIHGLPRLGARAARPQRCVHRLGVGASCPPFIGWECGRRARIGALLGRECGRRARIGVKHCVDHAPPNTRRNHDCCPTTCSCAGTSVRQESKAF